MKLEAVY